jgi:hypothetical protein
MNSFIKQIPGVFSRDFCNNFLNIFEQLNIPAVKNEYNFDGAHEEYKYLDSFYEIKNIDKEIKKAADLEVKKYLEPLRHFYPLKNKLDGTSVLKLKQHGTLSLHYDPEITQDKHVNLYDIKAKNIMMRIHNFFRKNTHHRHLSVLMYLQDMQGGELYFPMQKVLVKPEPGLMVIFPTLFTHPHTVFPTLDKHRYTYRFNYIIED